MKKITLFAILGVAAAGCAFICTRILSDKNKEADSDEECPDDCSCDGYAESSYPDVAVEDATETDTVQEPTPAVEEETSETAPAPAVENADENTSAKETPDNAGSNFYEVQAEMEAELQAELEAKLEAEKNLDKQQN